MNTDTPLLETKSLSKTFDAGEDSIQPLQSIDFVATSGNFIAIMGPSGSGKTTLLNLMAGLDKPTNGKGLFEGKDVVILIEAKNMKMNNIIIRQLYYPYRKWKIDTGKKVIPLFFEKRGLDYMMWMYEFTDELDYNSIKLVRSAKYRIV